MRYEMKCVEAFHELLDVSHKVRLSDLSVLTEMLPYVNDLAAMASEIETSGKISQDPRWLRLHLELEELAEKFRALMDCDEVIALDGAADQLYVVLGTAVTFDWPLAAAFGEVHASNMTKRKQEDDASKDRVRQKGAQYRPPNVAAVLERYRRGDKALSAFRQQFDQQRRALLIVEEVPEPPAPTDRGHVLAQKGGDCTVCKATSSEQEEFTCLEFAAHNNAGVTK